MTRDGSSKGMADLRGDAKSRGVKWGNRGGEMGRVVLILKLKRREIFIVVKDD